MMSPSPWINEGHAELFEHAHFDSKGKLVFEQNYEYSRFIHANAAVLAELIPVLLTLDYDGFYAGEQQEREAKYRLAWSIAFFLQVGAPNVRFRPFENLRSDYMQALLSTRSGSRATQTVLTDEMRKDLVDEWLAFWKKN